MKSHASSFAARVIPLSIALSLTVFAASNAMASTYSQDGLPHRVKVPDGHRVAIQTVGVGEITYECCVKKDVADQFEWTFVGRDAALNDRSGMKIGRYQGPPATWENADGSRVTGAQVAVAPAGACNIPHQLVKDNPASGSGAMSGVTYIQRVATVDCVAPATACDAGKAGVK